MHLPEMIFPDKTAIQLIYIFIFTIWLGGTLRDEHWTAAAFGIWQLKKDEFHLSAGQPIQRFRNWPFPPVIICLISYWLPAPVIIIHLVTGWIVEKALMHEYAQTETIRINQRSKIAPVPTRSHPSDLMKTVNSSIQHSAIPIAILAILWYILPADHDLLQPLFQTGYDPEASKWSAWIYTGWILGSGSITVWIWYFLVSNQNQTIRLFPLWLTARIIHGTLNAAFIKWLLSHPVISGKWF